MSEEDQQAADQSSDDRCRDKVFPEEAHFGFDPASKHINQYGKSCNLNQIKFNRHVVFSLSLLEFFSLRFQYSPLKYI